MLKQTITFKDFDENEVQEDFYFSLTKAELAEMELSQKGGMQEYLQGIIASEDGAAILKAFKDILTKSVGKKSEDGRRFIKNEEITNDFLQSGAYSEFFMQLVTDANSGAKFIQAVLPADLVTKSKELPAHPMAMKTAGVNRVKPKEIEYEPEIKMNPQTETVDLLSREDFEGHGLEKTAEPADDWADLELMDRSALMEELKKLKSQK